MDESTITLDIDNLTWDETWDNWSEAASCAIENGSDCSACEG